MNEIHTGDCFDVLAEIGADTFHACVTDPPYGLAFMGRDWDDFEPKEYQEWCTEWATEVKRVLKPGGHLLAFSGNRTHHRLFSGVEDAGFEIRDTLTWHYGSGYPKALDVSKAIDEAAGAEREMVRVDAEKVRNPKSVNSGHGIDGGDRPWMQEAKEKGYHEKPGDEPATAEAKQWDGWKTNLKPATEFIVLARKPLGEDTVAANVLEYGTGALNIDGTLIDLDGEDVSRVGTNPSRLYNESVDRRRGSDVAENISSEVQEWENTEGRYPANVIFDAVEAEALDREVGETVSTGGQHSSPFGDGHLMGGDGDDGTRRMDPGYGDTGGPSRYFYTSKATRAERTLNGQIQNAHPTVKPVDLMEWLVKLATKENHAVIDPFCGTGTTCKAAKGLGRQFVGIEQQAKWADVARARCGLAPNDPSRLRSDVQDGLETFIPDGTRSEGSP